MSKKLTFQQKVQDIVSENLLPNLMYFGYLVPYEDWKQDMQRIYNFSKAQYLVAQKLAWTIYIQYHTFVYKNFLKKREKHDSTKVLQHNKSVCK